MSDAAKSISITRPLFYSFSTAHLNLSAKRANSLIFVEKKLKKIERILGGPKFAVVIIILFSLFMIVGTFLESYSGADFANRLIYKNWPFILIQACMFTSICFAAFLRLPPKKRLYGFYTIHTGLICVGLGALITYICGIDGSIFLPTNEATRTVLLNGDLLKVHFQTEEKTLSYKLPYRPFAGTINAQSQNFSLGRYYPFAEQVFTWQKSQEDYPNQLARHSSRYLLESVNATEEFTLSVHPEKKSFKSSLQLGPLKVYYLPDGLAPCFAKPSSSGHILWNEHSNQCFAPEEKGATSSQTKSGKRFFVLKDGQKVLTFFPDLSPWPMNEEMNVNQESSWRTFSKNLFKGGPTLFLFGQALSYYEKDEGTWTVKHFDGGPIALPWMDFTVTLLEHSKDAVPALLPTPTTLPIQKNGQFIKGELRALEIFMGEKKFWVTNRRPLTLLLNGKEVVFSLQKEALTLPYELVLSRFKMDKDPGTNNPASYESFVSLFTEKGLKRAHVFMNNPLKHENMSFYQASYSQDERGNYASTLSVNIDQGRPLKYLGSLFVVLGAIIHFRPQVQRGRKIA